MKYKTQIYVIGFLFKYKMKKIVILIVTLLGICKGFAQNSTASATTEIKKIASDSIVKEKAAIKFYPNPAKNKAVLEVSGFKAGTVQLQIIDIAGKILRNDTRLLCNGNESLVLMFSVKPGIYFIVLTQKDTWAKKKMVVE